MNLKLKWHLKQSIEGYLFLPLSLTAFLIALGAIRTYKFYTYGVALYPEIHFQKVYPLQDALHVFWSVSLWPLLSWIPFTLPVDLFTRRVVFELHE